MMWWVAAIAGAALVVLHAFAWKRPSYALLPTARFLPTVSLPSRSRRFIPSDLALLVLRLIALALGAAALESPPGLPRSAATARVVVVDASRAVASTQERDDSVRAATQDAESATLIAFDSITRSLSSSGLDAVENAPVAGRLAAGLVAATREVARLGARFEQVEVVVVSPVVEEEWSPAIGPIIQGMGAPVRWSRIAAAAPRDTVVQAGRLPPATTPLGAAAWNALGRVPANTRVREGVPDAADTAFARAGGLIAWFRPASSNVHASQAIMAGDVVAIGGYARDVPGDGKPVAWWGDGAIAATERLVGNGCVRDVAMGLPALGDEVLRPALGAVMRELLVPCEAKRLVPVSSATLSVGKSVPVHRPPRDDALGRRLLLLLALGAIVAELIVRKRVEGGAARVVREATT